MKGAHHIVAIIVVLVVALLAAAFQMQTAIDYHAAVKVSVTTAAPTSYYDSVAMRAGCSYEMTISVTNGATIPVDVSMILSFPFGGPNNGTQYRDFGFFNVRPGQTQVNYRDFVTAPIDNTFRCLPGNASLKDYQVTPA